MVRGQNAQTFTARSLYPQAVAAESSHGVAGYGDGKHGDMGVVARAYRMAGVVRCGHFGSDASRPALTQQ